MKDIGSIFPLYDKDVAERDIKGKISAEYNNVCLYSLCREALYDIAIRYSDTGKRVLIPAYTCQTVIDPFSQLGWDAFFYSINKDLRIDTISLIDMVKRYSPDVVVAHPYYGMDFNEVEVSSLRIASELGARIIVDLTQSIYSKERLPFVDYYVGSYRKWYACPDGAFIEAVKGNAKFGIDDYSENSIFVRKQKDAMYLRGVYFHTDNEVIKQISIRQNKDAVSEISHNIVPHKMSDFSLAMMIKENPDFCQSRRINNYKRLFNGLSNCQKCSLVCNDLSFVTCAPLYFPIYVEDRAGLQKRLAQHHIYAPILWPVNNPDILINETITYIFNNILAIPCDHRYDDADMDRIINVFLEKD